MSEIPVEELTEEEREEIISRALNITRFTGLSVRITLDSVFLCGDNGASVVCVPKTGDPLEDLDNLFGSWVQLAQHVTCPTVQ